MAERLDLDATNLGAALDWLLVHGRRDDAADICWSMFIYYWLRGALSEGRRWTQRALTAEGPITPLSNARLLAADAFFAFWQRDFDVAVSEGMEAVEIAQREADADLDMVVSLLLLIVLAGAGDEAGARSYAARGLRLARAHEDQWGVAMTLNALCWFDAALGQIEGKEAAFDEMFEAARELADPMVLAMACANMAELRTWRGRYPEAAALLSEGAKMFAEMHLVSGGSSCLHGIAFLLAQLDDWVGAVQVQAATDAALQRIQATLWPPWLPRREHLLADAEQRLGSAAFEEALAAGREWTFEEAADQARAMLARVAGTAPSAARSL
jgi:non-specific serine/threonine protein kinase